MNGKNLKDLIAKLGLSVEEAAEKLEIGKSTLHLWYTKSQLSSKIQRLIREKLELDYTMIQSIGESHSYDILKAEIESNKKDIKLLQMELELLKMSIGKPSTSIDNNLAKLDAHLAEIQAMRKEYLAKKEKQG